MLGHTHAFDQHVVHICHHISVELCFENFVHHPLIGGIDIFQPEGYYFITVSPSVGDEARLFLIFHGHSDLIISQEGIHERH